MESCGKCNGTGLVTPNSTGEDVCFCCSGKGMRDHADHQKCVSYMERHPNHSYYCVEHGYVDPMHTEII